MIETKERFLRNPNEETTLSVDIVTSEIIDWWDDERARVIAESRACAEVTKARIEADFKALAKWDLVTPRSEAYSEIKERVHRDLEVLSDRLHGSITQNAIASVEVSEQRLEDDGMSLMDSLPFVATGAAAVGSLGLAAAATSFATTTATFMVFIPVSTFSWPMFAAFGAGALTLGYFSPQLLERSANSLRAKYVASFRKQIDTAIFGEGPQSKAICPQYLAQLDAICDHRLENLT